MRCMERVIDTFQYKDLSPTIPTHKKKDEKEKTVEDKKVSEQLGLKLAIKYKYYIISINNYTLCKFCTLLS